MWKRIHGKIEINILTKEPLADCNLKVYILIKPRLPISYLPRRTTHQNSSQIKETYLINACVFVMISIHSVNPENI